MINVEVEVSSCTLLPRPEVRDETNQHDHVDLAQVEKWGRTRVEVELREGELPKVKYAELTGTCRYSRCVPYCIHFSAD